MYKLIEKLFSDAVDGILRLPREEYLTVVKLARTEKYRMEEPIPPRFISGYGFAGAKIYTYNFTDENYLSAMKEYRKSNSYYVLRLPDSDAIEIRTTDGNKVLVLLDR